MNERRSHGKKMSFDSSFTKEGDHLVPVARTKSFAASPNSASCSFFFLFSFLFVHYYSKDAKGRWKGSTPTFWATENEPAACTTRADGPRGTRTHRSACSVVRNRRWKTRTATDSSDPPPGKNQTLQHHRDRKMSNLPRTKISTIACFLSSASSFQLFSLFSLRFSRDRLFRSEIFEHAIMVYIKAYRVSMTRRV